MNGNGNSLSASTLLIVDDDAFLRESLKRALYKEPYKLLVAASAEDALDILAKENVDVVLSDENMPGGMSGTEFLVQLKVKYPDIVRMMLTGHINYETAMRAINEGRVFRFIPKPCDTVELAITIRYALQQKQLQDAFKESEERFRRMSEAAFEGLVFSENGVFMDVNQKFMEMFGYEYGELIGKSALDLTVPEYRDIVADNIAKGYEKPYEGVGLRKDGTAFPYEVHGRAITIKGRNMRVTAVRDITDRKKVERELIEAKEQAESATKIKDKFISLVAHSLKSPLISMMSIIQALYMDGETSFNPEQKARLDGILQNAERAINTINELLDYSRLQSGLIKINPRFVDAHSVGELSIMSLGGMASGKGVTISNKIPKNSRLYADQHLFIEVIQNLASNAIKFTSKGGRITIFIPPGMETTVAVRDTGVGINEKSLPNLFKSDVLTTTVGTDGEAGTGLGLPMSLDIMKAHGGRLTVDSKVGEGSVFYASLPYVQPVVLLFKGEGSVRSMVEDCLQKIGAETIFSSSAEKAVAAIRSKRPHLIITGAQDSGIDGFSLIEKIRRDADTVNIPALMVTSDDSVGTRKRAVGLGVTDFIITPVAPADIINRLRRILA